MRQSPSIPILSMHRSRATAVTMLVRRLRESIQGWPSCLKSFVSLKKVTTSRKISKLITTWARPTKRWISSMRRSRSFKLRRVWLRLETEARGLKLLDRLVDEIHLFVGRAHVVMSFEIFLDVVTFFSDTKLFKQLGQP